MKLCEVRGGHSNDDMNTLFDDMNTLFSDFQVTKSRSRDCVSTALKTQRNFKSSRIHTVV
jgi:hypothetical protein